MNGRRWLLLGLLSIGGILALTSFALVAQGSGSALSRGADGWLAARRYLEARGARVTLIAEPLARYVVTEPRQARAGVLVETFPFQGAMAADLDQAVEEHLEHGGDVVLAYSGDGEGGESQLALWHWPPTTPVPLTPWRWRTFVRREVELRPSSPRAGRLPLRVWTPRRLPEPAAAQVLFTTPEGRPAVTLFRRHHGRVVMLPADALANARLAQPGSADLLEALRHNLGNRWVFDEYHHGLATGSGGDPRLGRTANLLVAHLVVLYLLGALALARRQGAAWDEPVSPGSSAAAFLLGLGALHHERGHHREAAALLLRRVREVDRNLNLPPAFDGRAATATASDLVDLARQIALRRGGGRVPGAVPP